MPNVEITFGSKYDFVVFANESFRKPCKNGHAVFVNGIRRIPFSSDKTTRRFINEKRKEIY